MNESHQYAQPYKHSSKCVYYLLGLYGFLTWLINPKSATDHERINMPRIIADFLPIFFNKIPTIGENMNAAISNVLKWSYLIENYLVIKPISVFEICFSKCWFTYSGKKETTINIIEYVATRANNSDHIICLLSFYSAGPS